ncbi:MAG: hypothetical protein WA941_12120 [Nitrososphaeraceae archaeon]
MKGRHDGIGMPFLESKDVPDIYRKTGRSVRRRMRVDRDNNRYTEEVEDKETGEIIHSVDEPLSEHRGHGSARRKKNDTG